MNVVVIGSGGREHALCESISKSKKIKKLFCIPGNGGTASIANNIKLNLNNFREIKNFIKTNKVDLVVVGPEKPLVEGICDYLEKHKIKVLVQVNLHQNSKALKFLQKKFVKNMEFQLLNLILDIIKKNHLNILIKPYIR